MPPPVLKFVYRGGLQAFEYCCTSSRILRIFSLLIFFIFLLGQGKSKKEAKLSSSQRALEAVLGQAATQPGIFLAQNRVMFWV